MTNDQRTNDEPPTTINSSFEANWHANAQLMAAVTAL
jgi:hypothetical protein